MLAPGDVDFLPGDRPAAIAIGFRLGPQRADIRTGLWLGQLHGGRPFSGHQLGQIHRLLFVGAFGNQGLDRPEGQHRAKAERHIRRLHRLHDGGAQNPRQAHAAHLGRELQTLPAAFDEFGIGLLDTLGRCHLAVRERASFQITGPVERCQHITGKLARLFQNGGCQIGGQFGKCARRFQTVHDGDFLEREAYVVNWCAIHGRSLSYSL